MYIDYKLKTQPNMNDLYLSPLDLFQPWSYIGLYVSQM